MQSVHLQWRKKSFNIAAILRKEAQDIRFIDITAKVISIGNICFIKKTSQQYRKMRR